MNVTAPTLLRPDEFPDVEAKLLELINANFRDLAAVLQRVPELTSREDLTFSTSGSGTAYLDVSTDRQVKELWVGRLRMNDGGEVTTAYSQTWTRMGGKVRLLFIGLDASTKYVCSMVYL